MIDLIDEINSNNFRMSNPVEFDAPNIELTDEEYKSELKLKYRSYDIPNSDKWYRSDCRHCGALFSVIWVNTQTIAGSNVCLECGKLRKKGDPPWSSKPKIHKDLL